MEGREGGFIVIARQVRSSSLYRSLTAEQRSVFIEVLLACNWKPTRMLYAGKWIDIARGQFVDSLETMAERAGVSVKVVRTTYAKLFMPNLGGDGEPFMVARWTGTEPGRGLRLITVVKYDQYQGFAKEEGTESGTESGIAGARSGHGRGTAGAASEPDKPVQPALPTAAPAAGEGAAAKRPDSRFAPLRAVWEAEFLKANGTGYRWGGPADATGIHRVIAISPDEFRARTRRALTATGYLRCGTVAKLTSNEVWNQLAGPSPPAGAAKRTMATVGNWDNPDEARAVPK